MPNFAQYPPTVGQNGSWSPRMLESYYEPLAVILGFAVAILTLSAIIYLIMLKYKSTAGR